MLCVSGLWRELQAVVQIEMLRPIQTGSEAALAVEQHGYPHLWMELGRGEHPIPINKETPHQILSTSTAHTPIQLGLHEWVRILLPLD